MDTKGNLYLHKSALLCKNEIIKRLTNGKYHLAEDRQLLIGKFIYLIIVHNRDLISALYFECYFMPFYFTPLGVSATK